MEVVRVLLWIFWRIGQLSTHIYGGEVLAVEFVVLWVPRTNYVWTFCLTLTLTLPT